ncbi:MAG TPA: DMT family transporter, partial [Daejeonella sp.]|nr:DMT family transporter [Daejeonella sp.]
LGACSFGILSTFVKIAYQDGFTPGDVTGSQAFFGMVILWPIYLLQKNKIASSKNKQRSQTATSWWKLVLAGTSTGLVSIFYYQCVQLIPASIAIILLMQFTWISMLLEALFFKQKPTPLHYLAVILVLIGTILASGLLNVQVQHLDVKGLCLGLLAAFCYAVFLMINGRVGNDLPPIKKSALMLTGACTLIFIIFPPVFLFNGALMNGLFKWAIILSIFGTVIPPIFFATGIPKIGVALTAIVSSVELPVAVSMSYFVLTEDVDVKQWIGIIIILSAIVIPNLNRLSKKNRGALL